MARPTHQMPLPDSAGESSAGVAGHLRLCRGDAAPDATRPDVAEHALPPQLPPAQDSASADEPLTFDRLFSEHARFVAGVAMRVLGRDDEVDDIVQDVFMCALKELSRLRQPQAVRGWLKTITVRKAYRLLRRRRLRAWLGLDDPAWRQASALEVPAPSCSPEERSLLRRVYQLLDQLPAAERLAWTLRYLDGERLEAVAALCDCSLATAKRRVTAAHSFIERTLIDA